MIYLLIDENEKLISICDYLPNIGDDPIKIIKYDGKIPIERIIYLDGTIRDMDNYFYIEGKYIPKNVELERQFSINTEARTFLNDTDWLVIRHRDQQELGIEKSLSDDEYLALLEKRQEARQKVVYYDS